MGVFRGGCLFNLIDISLQRSVVLSRVLGRQKKKEILQWIQCTTGMNKMSIQCCKFAIESLYA